MANYQQYQKYRAPSERKSLTIGRILVILAIVFVIYLIGRSLFGSQPKVTTTFPGQATNTTTNESANLNGNTNADTNANANSNANVNAAANVNTATPGNFDLSKCKAMSSRGTTAEQQAALTFNVGTAKEGEIQKVLDALTAAQTPADFFARGDVADSNPDLINKISRAGFPIYNLSFSYPHFNDLPASGITEQLSKADTAISQRTSKTTQPFFRPPFGETPDADVLAAITAAGYCPVGWSIDAMDWSSDYTADQSKERVLSKVANGSIVLMQASNSVTAQIVPDLITQLKAKGYRLVHLEDILQ